MLRIKVQLEVVTLLEVVDFQIYLVVVMKYQNRRKELVGVLKDKAVDNNKVEIHLILNSNKINNKTKKNE